MCLSLSGLGQRLRHAPLPFTSWLAGGMLLRCPHLRSCCSHSHLLLLLHLVLQELQLSGMEERRKTVIRADFTALMQTNCIFTVIQAGGSNSELSGYICDTAANESHNALFETAAHLCTAPVTNLKPPPQLLMCFGHMTVQTHITDGHKTYKYRFFKMFYSFCSYFSKLLSRGSSG